VRKVIRVHRVRRVKMGLKVTKEIRVRKGRLEINVRRV